MPKKLEKTEEKTEVKQKQFKLSDSYGSLLLGLVVVVVVIGILIFAFRGEKKLEETSSIQDEATSEETAKEVEVNEAGQKVYTVKKGDDLWSIAENIYKDGYKWVEIVKANKITNPSIIEKGQKLVIPDSKEPEPTVTPSNTPTPTKTPVTPKGKDTKKVEEGKITDDKYTVKKGDHLWGIAVRAYGDGYKWVDIAKANKLSNPDIIHQKNVLKLPR